MSEINASFNLATDFVEEPLVPQGNYFGNITKIGLDTEKYAIVWNITLDGNSGLMTDGETDVDGNVAFFRNWLPRPGDETEMTSSGRSTKRQSKINMLAKFIKVMGLNVNTMDEIEEAVLNQEWIGKQVVITVGITEYNGTVRNEVNKMVAAA